MTTQTAWPILPSPRVSQRAPRLLPPAGQSSLDLTEHLERHGPLPHVGNGQSLIDDVRAAGLTGRGGAAFPVHRKLSAVCESDGPAVVVANGAEGEPASAKDKSLLLLAPHLVLDGMQLAAQAVGADDAVLYIGADQRSGDWLNELIVERRSVGIDRVPVRVVEAPARFISGESSALARKISGGPALPMFTPQRLSERGVDGRPTLVQNVETLAHLSLIARYGPSWFRRAGTEAEPGTMIATLHQPDGRAEITEVPIGVPLSGLLTLRSAAAVLVGGYHGAWLPASTAEELAFSDAALRPHGASVGAGVLAALPADRCGLRETARIARYLALESAGQCGPCLNGLPRIAGALAELADVGDGRSARVRHPDPSILAQLDRWSGLVERRGACNHPDGTVRFVASALRTFRDEVTAHRQGRCTAPSRQPFLPVPAEPATDTDRR